LDRVSHVEPVDAGAGPAPDYQTPPWMELIGADQAKAGGLTGTGVKVAVVDTGVDSNHPDLRGQVVAAKDFTGTGSPEDEDGHGTFVASEIAGAGTASSGVFSGVAPGAKIVNARVLDAFGQGANSGILAGIEWAAQQGARVINLSLGDPGMYGDGTSYFDQFVNQVAKDYGALIVVAAGNDGRLQTVATPAVADEVLSVGATSQSGNRAGFSSAGPRRGDGAVNPQIVAPGAGAEANRADTDGEEIELLGMTGAKVGSSGYVSDQMGTSMAAPLVAGAAALLIESDPTLDRHALRAKLMASASPAPDGVSVFEQGAGLLSIPRALSQTLTTSPTELNLGMTPFPATGTVTETLTYANAGSADQQLTLEAGLTISEYLGPVVISTDPPGPAEPGKSTSRRAAAAGAIPPTRPDHIELSETTLTVPAGGQASVAVTVDVGAFGGGYMGGYVTAADPAGATVLRTPVGLANQPEMHKLAITATDHDGQPIEKSDINHSLALVDLNRGSFTALQPSQGKVTLDVAAGDYALLGYAAKTNASGGTDELVAAIPMIGLKADTTVNLDGKAARPVTAPVDQPVEGFVTAQVTVAVGAGESAIEFSTGLTSAVSPLGVNSTYVAVPPADDGVTTTFPATASLAQPSIEGALDPYGARTVPLADPNDRLPAGRSAFSLVRAVDGIPPDGAADQALLVELPDPDPSEETIALLAEVLTDIQAAGYGAVVIGSNRPIVTLTVARLAVYLGAGGDGIGQLAVLVSNKAGIDQLAAAAAQGESLHILGRGGPEYVYQVGRTFRPGEPFQLATDESATAQVTVQHRAMGATGSIEDVFWGEWAQGATAIRARPAASYVAHVGADQQWSISSTLLGPDGGTPVNEFITAPMEYSAGQSAVVTMGSQVHSVGFDTTSEIAISRDGDVMYGVLPRFVDGQGHAELPRYPDAAPAYGASDAKLTDVTTGAVLLQRSAGAESASGFWLEGLDPAEHAYRLEDVTASDSAAWSWSTEVSSKWEWVSAAEVDPSAAPLLQVWYELEGLDAYNAGAARQPVTLHVGQLLGSPTMPSPTVSLEASTDRGVTWAAVELRAGTSDGAAGGLYSGEIAAAAGDVVSLRSRVRAGSSSFDQTVLDAYPVTDSPRGFVAAEAWPSRETAGPRPSETLPAPAVGSSTPPDPGRGATPSPRESAAAAAFGRLPVTGAVGLSLAVGLGLVLIALGAVLRARSRSRAR
jgi:hypothetical protein